jgi:hypothetical protein
MHFPAAASPRFLQWPGSATRALLQTSRDALAAAQGDSRAEKSCGNFDLLNWCLSRAGDIGGATGPAQLAIRHCSEGQFQQVLTERLAALEAFGSK